MGENKFDLAVPLVPADPKVKNESIKQKISVIIPFLWSMNTLYELRVTSFEFRVSSFEFPVTSYELWVTSYELRVMNYELRVTRYGLRVMSMTFLDLLTNLYESSHHPYPLPHDLPPPLPNPSQPGQQGDSSVYSGWANTKCPCIIVCETPLWDGVVQFWPWFVENIVFRHIFWRRIRF